VAPLRTRDERSGLDKCLDRAFKVFAIVGGMAMIWVTCHFSDVASDLSEQGIEVTQTQRKYSILPSLEVLPGINYTKEYDEIVVPIRNYGVGKAVGVRALVAYEGAIHGEVYHQFITANGSPVTSGKVLLNEPGIQQEMFTLGDDKGKDWISPGETVQFRFNPWLDVNRPADFRQIQPNREFSIFLSFLDIDRNEYLLITRTPIGGRSALTVIAAGSQGFTDSLLALEEDVRLFTSTMYNNIHLRSESGWFISIESDSSAGDSSFVDTVIDP